MVIKGLDQYKYPVESILVSDAFRYIDGDGGVRHLPQFGGLDDQPADLMEFIFVVQSALIKKWEIDRKKK